MGKVITTSRGVQLECLPIGPLLEKLAAQYKQPDPPTYEVKTATGIVEKHFHDETTLETDAEKAAWADYKARLRASEIQGATAMMRLILLRGIKMSLPEDESWIKEQEYIGFKVPTEPRERWQYWLETEALADEDDYVQLVIASMQASGVSEEAVAEAEATFRGTVGRHAAGGPEPAGDGQALENVKPVRASKNGDKKRHPARERV